MWNPKYAFDGFKAEFFKHVEGYCQGTGILHGLLEMEEVQGFGRIHGSHASLIWSNFPTLFPPPKSTTRWLCMHKTIMELVHHQQSGFNRYCLKNSKCKSSFPWISGFPNWILDSNGQFPLRSVYEALGSTTQINVTQDPVFLKVDKWKGPARIRSHLWKIARGYLLTND